MIDIQNHIRNEGLLNLFDGKGCKPAKRPDTRFVAIDWGDDASYQALYEALKPWVRLNARES